MLFESKLKLPTKTTSCAAHGLEKHREFDAEPQHTLYMNHGETLTLMVNGPHDEVREIQITVSGSVTLIEDVKTQDSLLIRRSKNVAVIGEKTLIGESQIV
jgi:hypothetical protein